MKTGGETFKMGRTIRNDWEQRSQTKEKNSEERMKKLDDRKKKSDYQRL